MYSTEHLEIGYKIGSHYEIQKVLGQGGFGIVYLVKDKHQLEKILVVKELFSKEFSFRNRDSNAVSNKTKSQNIFKKIKEGIVREVKILSEIRNSNIVTFLSKKKPDNQDYLIFNKNVIIGKIEILHILKCASVEFKYKIQPCKKK